LLVACVGTYAVVFGLDVSVGAPEDGDFGRAVELFGALIVGVGIGAAIVAVIQGSVIDGRCALCHWKRAMLRTV